MVPYAVRGILMEVDIMPKYFFWAAMTLKTADGKVTFSVNGSGSTKGLSYSFAKVMRAGLITINGERLPGAPD